MKYLTQVSRISREQLTHAMDALAFIEGASYLLRDSCHPKKEPIPLAKTFNIIAKLVARLKELNTIVGSDDIVVPGYVKYAFKRLNNKHGFNINAKMDCYAMIELQYGYEGLSFAKLLEGLGYDPLTTDFWNALLSHINATSVQESLSIPATAFEF